jgi:DNA-binding transcriptional LysR family regulator
MELYHLKTFVTVAEEQHLTRAADRLYTSQPAISAHIKGLEEEVGMTLFNRTPKGMHLTPAGEQLLKSARIALAAAGDFLQQAKAMQDELIGSVRIGVNSDATFLRLVELQAAMSQRYPRLNIEFLSGTSTTNVPNLRIGRLDAAFVSGVCDDPLLDVWTLGDEELAVAVPESLREQVGAGDIDTLACQPWVYTSADCVYYGVMRTLFEAHGCEPVKTVLANQEDTLRAMVVAGFGLGIMRRSDIEAPEHAGLIYALPLQLPTIALNFAYLKKRASDPVIRAVMAELATIWAFEVVERREAG